MKRGLVFVVLVALVGCTTGGSDANPSTATVLVAAIAPVAGSEVQQSSVIEATVEFTIDKFKLKGDTYYLLVDCEDVSGGSVDRDHPLADQPILTAAKGSLVVTYPLSKVWSNPRLKKPVRVWFDVVERVGPNDSVVIGRAGPIEYATK